MRSIFSFVTGDTSSKSENKEQNYTPILLQEFLAGGKDTLPNNKEDRKKVLKVAKEEYLAKSPQEKGAIFASWLGQLDEDKRQEFITKLKLGEEGMAVEELKKSATVSSSSFSLSNVGMILAGLATHFGVAVAGDPNLGTAKPSSSPTLAPSRMTFTPTLYPTSNPTFTPTSNPTFTPTSNPTANITAFLTDFFSVEPSVQPSEAPSVGNQTLDDDGGFSTKNILETAIENPYIIWVAAGVAAVVCCGCCIGYCCSQKEKVQPLVTDARMPTSAEVAEGRV